MPEAKNSKRIVRPSAAESGKGRNDRAGRVFIGTSGWMYKSWHEIFYPRDLKKDFLVYYSKHFNSLEINTSFYHLPKKSVFKKWHDETPESFVFAVKMSRYITHIKQLKNCKMAIRRFMSAAASLKEKLAVILVQLPPRLAFNEKTFSKFLDDLNAVKNEKKKSVLFAIEPRHPSWFEGHFDKIKRLMTKYGTALVLAHSSVFPYYDPDKDVFSSFVYLRFHGPGEFAGSEYGEDRLKIWAKRIRKWARLGKAVFAYFNDDAMGYAVKDAKILQTLVKRK